MAARREMPFHGSQKCDRSQGAGACANLADQVRRCGNDVPPNSLRLVAKGQTATFRERIRESLVRPEFHGCLRAADSSLIGAHLTGEIRAIVNALTVMHLPSTTLDERVVWVLRLARIVPGAGGKAMIPPIMRKSLWHVVVTQSCPHWGAGEFDS